MTIPTLRLVLILVLFIGACGSGSTAVSGDRDARAGYATLIIENDSPSAVTVYALRDGGRQRIGTIPGLSTERISIRRILLTPGGELRVAVDPIGSSRVYTAQPILVNEGDVLEMTVSSFVR